MKGSVDMNLIPKNFYLDDIFDDFVPTFNSNKMKCDFYEKIITSINPKIQVYRIRESNSDSESFPELKSIEIF